mgnify:CR=1 FL=1
MAMTMMQAMGRMQKTDWANLTQWDRYRMESMGLTADDWATLVGPDAPADLSCR